MRLGLRWVLALALLLSIARLDSYYEQDEMAKAAQVMALARENSLLRLHDLPDYYRRDMFSSFYLVATLFYKITGLSAVQAINLLSVLCGACFLALAPGLFARVIGASEWLIFAVLVSVPGLMVTFCYGNEVPVALLSILLAACVLRWNSRVFCVVAAAFFCIATYARTDYVFLFPALALLALVYERGKLQVRPSLIRVGVLSSAAFVFGVLFFFFVIKKVPDPEFWEHRSDLRLVGAFVVYGMGALNFACALLGFALCLAARRWKLLLAGVLLLQTAPYLNHMTSPKYILPSLVAGTVFSVVGFQWIARRSRVLCGLLLLSPWLVAASPFGIFVSPKSALWYLPSDAGPLPTGGFLWFYARVKSGFHQRRYDMEIEQIDKAMPVVDSAPQGADIVGTFQPGSLRIWSTQHGRWEIPPKFARFLDNDLLPASMSHRKLVIKSTFLYEFKNLAPVKAALASFYAQNRVAKVTHEDDPFPDVIEVGPLVPADHDVDLTRRICFVNQRSGGEQWLRRDTFIPEYGGLAWLRADQFRRNPVSYPLPVYNDAEWVCFAQNVPGAIFYSLRFPPAYSKNRQAANLRQ